MIKTEASSDQYYVDTVSRAEEIFNQAEVEHRFVGGIVTDTLGADTIVKVDSLNRQANIYYHRPFSLIRPDQTVKDLDVIGFSLYPESYREAERKLAEEARLAKQKGLPYPDISTEATYYPGWRKRNRTIQLVSTFDVDDEEKLYLNFGSISQQIPWETVDPWVMTFDGGLKFTTINPVGLMKCYSLRTYAGIKKKDLAPAVLHEGVAYSKMDLIARAAQFVDDQAFLDQQEYFGIYQSWDEYTDRLLNHPDGLTRVKALVTRLYWNTIGPSVAHGRGWVRPLVSFNSKFTG